MAARLTGVTIALVALIALLWARACTSWWAAHSGSCRPSARLMALGLAVGNMILLPFGTALGGYACWVLLKDEGRRLFEHDQVCTTLRAVHRLHRLTWISFGLQVIRRGRFRELQRGISGIER